MADLTDFARADDIYDDFFPSFLSMASAKDRLYGLAFQPSTPVLYYNKEAFAKAGIAKAPTTWNELFETARALTVREGDQVRQWGLTIGGGWHDWIFECWVRQNGMIPWQSDKVMFDSPESVNALEFWVKMVKDGVMPAASTWEGSANDFMAGRSAMLYHSTGSLTNLRTSSKFGVGVALMPRNKTDGASLAKTHRTSRIATWADSPLSPRSNSSIGVRRTPRMTASCWSRCRTSSPRSR